MKILVTGAGGFVGPHLIRELIKTRHQVVATDRAPARSSIPDACHFAIGDLTDGRFVDSLLGGSGVEAIIHLAGWSHVGASWEHPAEAFEANVITTVRLFEAAAHHLAGEPRFLLVSSADVYGGPMLGEPPLGEQSPVRPASPYAVSKYAAEMALDVMTTKTRIELMIARPFNHIGPGQSPEFACPDFARQIARIECGRQEVLEHGNLMSKRDFLDVRDVCRAYRLILESGAAGERFVIASGNAVSMESILDQMFRIAGMVPRHVVDPSRFRPVDTKELRGDPGHLMKRTGWRPQIGLEQSLRDILEEARASIQSAAK